MRCILHASSEMMPHPMASACSCHPCVLMLSLLVDAPAIPSDFRSFRQKRRLECKRLSQAALNQPANTLSDRS